MSETITTFYEKLSEIQTSLKAPKNQRNNFGKYNYRSCEDILEAVKPFLQKYKLYLNITDDIVDIGGRVYVKAIVTISDGEREEQSVGFAREEENKKGMDCSQITGAASSYARKYALNGLLCIDDTKDSDFTNTDFEPDYKCEKCGKPFAAFSWNGKNYTSKDAYEMSRKKYNGHALCKDCGQKESEK